MSQGALFDTPAAPASRPTQVRPAAPPPSSSRAAATEETVKPLARGPVFDKGAINRFAWSVRDMRALGMAGSWRVRPAEGDQPPAIIIDMSDDATANAASDAIWGAFQE